MSFARVLILFPLSVMACDHRALSPGGEGEPAPTDGQVQPQDGAGTPEETLLPSFCEGASSITGALEGVQVELPHAFYGLSVEHRCAYNPPGTPLEQWAINLLFTINPDECLRLEPSSSWYLPARGVRLNGIEIHGSSQPLEGWKIADDAMSNLDIDYRVEADLRLQPVPPVLRDGRRSTPGPEDEVEGCVALRFRTHSPITGDGDEVGRARGAFRARYCPALDSSIECWD